jgi:Lectin C-type domain
MNKLSQFLCIHKATFEEASKLCEKENMQLLSLESEVEQDKVTQYINYIGKNKNAIINAFVLMFLSRNKGLTKDPVFSALGSVGSIQVKKWGTGPSPGGPGPCLVQKNGVLYNASCSQKMNFACEEKLATVESKYKR